MRLARAVGLPLLMAVGALSGTPAHAVLCSLDIAQVLIGTYSALGGEIVQQQPIRVRCVVDAMPIPANQTVSVNLKLGAGAPSGILGWRALPGPGGAVLHYNLFLPPNWQIPWGDGPNDSLNINVTGLNALNASNTSEVTLKLAVPERQWGARPGIYSDRLSVTLNF